MKKLVSILLVLAMCLGILAGCGNTTTEPDAEKQTEGAATPAPGEQTGEVEEQVLSIAIFEGGYGPDYWVEIVQMFEETHPGVTVNMQINPKIGDIIRPQIVAGNVPDFIAMQDNDQTGVISSLIKEHGLLDITDVFEGAGYDDETPLKDQVLEGILETSKCSPYGDGKIYLAPFNASPMGLVYNKTLFKEMGYELPETWDDFFALGDQAKEDGIALFTYQGIYPGYVESVLWPALASASGLDNLSAIANCEPGSFSTPEVLEVLENIAKIGTGGYLMEGTTALNHTQSQNEMMLNKALFIPNGNWMEGEMADAPRADGFEFGLWHAPVLNEGDEAYVMTSVEQFSIPANAKNPELAKEFLRFLYSDESVKLFSEKSNGIYALKDATEMVKDVVTQGVYGMNEVYEHGTSMVYGWSALPEGCKVTPNDDVFNVMTDIMTGKMTAQEWSDLIEADFEEVTSMK